MQTANNYNELPANFWEIIEEHLPNYHSRSDVALSNDLTMFIDDDDMSDQTRKYMESYVRELNEDPTEHLQKIDLALYNESVKSANKL